MTEQERRELAYQHRGEVVEGSGVAVQPRMPPVAPGVDVDAIRALVAATSGETWELRPTSTLYMSGRAGFTVRMDGQPGIKGPRRSCRLRRATARPVRPCGIAGRR